MDTRTIRIFSAPSGRGGPKGNGTDRGASAILEAGLREQLSDAGLPVHVMALDGEEPLRYFFAQARDWGDAAANLAFAGALGALMREEASQAFAAGETPLTLGGDHSLSAGPIAAALSYARERGKRLGLVICDQHLDAHTHETSHSGNPHGMQFSALLGQRVPHLSEVVGSDFFRPVDVLYIGTGTPETGSYEPEEDVFLRSIGVRRMPVEELRTRGVERACADITRFADAYDALYVSWDMDVTNAPGVHYAFPTGLDEQESLAVARALGRSGKIIGADIMELDPTSGDASTERRAVAIVSELFMPRVSVSPQSSAMMAAI